jgi:prepilin peptidase CpaA
MGVQTILVALVALTGAATDIRTGKVYNWLTYPAALAGLALSFFFEQPGPLECLAGLIGALVVFGTLRKVGPMGAGDVKLLAAVGAIKGFTFLVFASFYTIVFAGIAAVLILARDRRLVPTLRWAATVTLSAIMPGLKAEPLTATRTEMPFAPAILFGTLWCLYLEVTSGPFSL